jgi:hypothetical protein
MKGFSVKQILDIKDNYEKDIERLKEKVKKILSSIEMDEKVLKGIEKYIATEEFAFRMSKEISDRLSHRKNH